MQIKVLKPFYDKSEGVTRKLGDTFTVSEKRYNEINSTKNGVLVEAVAEETAELKPRRKPKKG